MLPKASEGAPARLSGGLGLATVALALVLLVLGVLPSSLAALGTL
jgi:hypothetical protein